MVFGLVQISTRKMHIFVVVSRLFRPSTNILVRVKSLDDLIVVSTMLTMGQGYRQGCVERLSYTYVLFLLGV